MILDDPAVPRVRRPGTRYRAMRLLRLMHKELRETLRDRRTIITLVLMPILVYPLLSITFQRFLLSNLQPQQGIEYAVGFESERDARLFEQHVLFAEPLQADDEQQQHLRGYITPGLVELVTEMELDLGIRIHGPDSGGINRMAWEYELIYRPQSVTSREALQHVERLLQQANVGLLQQRLAEQQLADQPPLAVRPRKVDAAGGASFSLATLVPLILILMTITGAVYPAIDLTAGERERGTLEMLVAAPVPRLALLVAKYTAALTVAILTATVNLISMAVTIYFSGLLPMLFGEEGLSWTIAVEVFGLMVLFAAFFSAILLVLTSFARSFKEAQAYLIPLMVLAIAPGLLTLMPGLRLDSVLSVMPLVNIVLLARDIIEGTAQALPALAAILSTILYAIAAIGVAAHIFGTDAVLYANGGSWKDLTQRPRHVQAVPSLASALMCLSLIFPIYFVLSHLILRFPQQEIALRLVLAALVTALLFVLLPLLVAFQRRIVLRTGFRLRRSGWLSLVASGILGLALWPFAHELFLLNQLFGLSLLDQDRMAATRQLLESWQQVSPALIVLAMGVVPGVCEEFFFRGYLLTALQGRLHTTSAIVLAAVLFGLFHVVTPQVLALERFLPSTFLGLALGWVAYRTSSVVPAMILHLCHNSFLLLVAYYHKALAVHGWAVQEQAHLPLTWLLTAAVVATAAAALLNYVGGPRHSSNAANLYA